MSNTREIKVEIDGTYMNVITFGEGKKNLIIISGMNVCGLEGQSETIRSAYEIFEKDYTVWLFDRKKLLPERYSTEDMAEDVYKVSKALGIDRSDVYGVSQGGMIGLCIAIEHPEFVRKLIICSALCRCNDKLRELCTHCIELCEKEDIVSLNRMLFDGIYSEKYLDTYKDVLPALEKQGTTEDMKHYAVLARACIDFDVYDKLSDIRCPVYVLTDTNDKVIGPEGSYEIADTLGCRLEVYKDYSHAVYDESPDIKEKLFVFLNND